MDAFSDILAHADGKHRLLARREAGSSSAAESRISSNATAEDHLAAALLYRQQANLAKAETRRYEETAASIKPIEDPKGFRRNALLTAAQERRQAAEEMQQLYASHEAKAQTMLGKQQPQ